MTYNEIVDPYLASLSLKREKDCKSINIIFPHIIMDAQYQVLQRKILKMEFVKERKKLVKNWHDCYNRFNYNFWKPYYIDLVSKKLTLEGKAVCDFLASYEDFISHHLDIFKISIMNMFMDLGADMETQDLVSDCYICNALAKSAQTVYNDTYKSRMSGFKSSVEIEGVIGYSTKLRKSLFNEEKKVSEKRIKAIDESINIIVKKSIFWLKDESHKVMDAYA